MGCLTAIGVTAGERAVKQQLSIDLEFPIDGGSPATTDSIEDAVDYDTVARTVAEVCSQSGVPFDRDGGRANRRSSAGRVPNFTGSSAGPKDFAR